MSENKQADLKSIANLAGTSRLSFASPETLYDVLRLYPGSVSPFGIINDKDNVVILIIDAELKNKKLLFHPNINTKTIAIQYDDLIKFVEFTNHHYICMP